MLLPGESGEYQAYENLAKGSVRLEAMMPARRPTQGAVRTRDIAFEEALAEKFLEPILLEQKNARMLESVRGAKGGYKLRRPPSEIYLGRNHSTDRRHWSPFADRAQLRDRIENDVDRQALFLVFLDVRDWGGEDSRKHVAG